MPKIVIYTWGNKVRKGAPSQSQKNFCVTSISSYKPKGLDLKNIDGRNERLQEKLMRQKRFPVYFNAVMKSIVNEGLTSISINCHKGRHRSVGFAELLSSELEDQGYEVELIHMELK
jgi:RNase adaptor protein for sRNA GlmZ degradation